jgi:predicted small secreted protein
MSSRLLAPSPSRLKTPLRLSLVALVAAAALAGCGGGGGSTGPSVVPAPPVDGPAWFGFGRDAQHGANSLIATQDLNRISWSTPLYLAPVHTAGGALLVHYGSPVVTSHNTIVLPVKTGAAGGFRIEARSGGNGGLIWSAATDYQLPPHNWVPSYNAALTTGNRL